MRQLNYSSDLIGKTESLPANFARMWDVLDWLKRSRRKRGTVAKSPKWKQIVKVCVLNVYQSFYNDQGHVFISRTNRVLADHGKYITWRKRKRFPKKNQINTGPLESWSNMEYSSTYRQLLYRLILPSRTLILSKSATLLHPFTYPDMCQKNGVNRF